MSTPKSHNKTLSNRGPARPGPRRPSPGAPAQEAVGLLKPDPLADARGRRPRKNPRTQAACQGTDACGTEPRKRPRSASSGVEADACGAAPRKSPRARAAYQGTDARGRRPRKTSRPVGRGRRPRGRRPNSRRSLSHVSPSLPRLSTDSPDIEGEIALLRSLTNRLLSTRPLDYTQINRCLRLIIRAYTAQAKAPKQLTDEQQIDNLIKKVFQDNIDKGDLRFRDLVPVRMARPGDKWWPWRQLLPLKDRWSYGLIDPDEPWPQEENERLAESEAMQKFIAKAYLTPDFLKGLDTEDEDPDPDDDDYDPDPDDDEAPPHLTVIPDPDRESIPGGGVGGPAPSPLMGEGWGEGYPLPVGVAAHAEALEARAGVGPHTTDPSPHDEDSPPQPRIARGRPPP